MESNPTHLPDGARGDGALARAVRRAAQGAARRPKTIVVLWLVAIVALVFSGASTGTKLIEGSDGGAGESRSADRLIERAGLEQPATEQVLIRSADRATTTAAAADLERRLPSAARADSADAGHTVLVNVKLRGDPEKAKERLGPLDDAVAAVERAHPRANLDKAGQATLDKAFDRMMEEDLARGNTISLPLTLLILFFAFGALVAASVPLLLGLTAVAGAFGALGLISQVVPASDTSTTLVILIGLAVGVDYSLFYIRREREERRAGRGPDAALAATAATVGRAVVIAGATVMVALAGLLFTGLAEFTSMALATITVVAIAVVGSVTVLPAVLALLGDRVDRGRLPLVGRLRARRAGRRGAWTRIADAVTRRPVAALVVSLALLGTLAVPALGMKTGDAWLASLPGDLPELKAQKAVERAFPGSPADAELVVSGDDLRGADAGRRMQALGAWAAGRTGGRGPVDVDVARDGSTAVVSVPMPQRGAQESKDAVAGLRSGLDAQANRVAPGAEVRVTGDAAQSADFADRMRTTTPLVIAFVLALAFALLIAAFRSPALAATVVGLNLLSVGATYGVLVAVFQIDWAESLLGFTSTGTIASWVPLFSFVILFGLSMDYSIVVLERIREGRRAGLPAREAAAAGVAATAGTVTSAAVVMVSVFGIFATMRFLDLKQLGVGLAAAILLDATIIRAVALPAAVTLLGERRWRVRPRRRLEVARDAA